MLPRIGYENAVIAMLTRAADRYRTTSIIVPGKYSLIATISIAGVVNEAGSLEELEEVEGIANGIFSSLHLNPEWFLQNLKIQSKLSQMQFEAFVESFREEEEYRHKTAEAWANALAEETYVRDPDTKEVFRLDDTLGEYWRSEIGDVIMSLPAGELDEGLLKAYGWKKMEVSLEGWK